MFTAVVVSLAKVASIVAAVGAPRLIYALDGLGLQGILGAAGTAGTGLAAVVVPVLFAGALLAKAQRMATAPIRRR